MAWNWVSLGRYQDRLASGLKISAIGGSDFHQPARLMPEGPLALARPTTVLWLDELSEDAILAAMKAGRGYVTESPTGPHVALTVNGQPMGSTTHAEVTATAETKCAEGDTLVWIDATGILSTETIGSDDWTGGFTGRPKAFLRTEIIAAASREGLISAFSAALEGRSLPWQLQSVDMASQPIRRAISNPVYVEW
jgi:hypothetical protein